MALLWRGERRREHVLFHEYSSGMGHICGDIVLFCRNAWLCCENAWLFCGDERGNVKMLSFTKVQGFSAMISGSFVDLHGNRGKLSVCFLADI